MTTNTPTIRLRHKSSYIQRRDFCGRFHCVAPSRAGATHTFKIVWTSLPHAPFQWQWLACLALFGTLTTPSAFAARHTVLQPTHAPLPRDVSAYVQRRDLCDHFRGEYPAPSETTRMAEVVHALDRYCPGSDARLTALKTRYRDNKAVKAALAGYEPHIEP